MPYCHEAELAEYREKARRSREEEAKKREAHKRQLARECGVLGSPKLDLLYQKAWDRGHSSGWDEVATYFRDLADLIR